MACNRPSRNNNSNGLWGARRPLANGAIRNDAKRSNNSSSLTRAPPAPPPPHHAPASHSPGPWRRCRPPARPPPRQLLPTPRPDPCRHRPDCSAHRATDALCPAIRSRRQHTADDTTPARTNRARIGPDRTATDRAADAPNVPLATIPRHPDQGALDQLPDDAAKPRPRHTITPVTVTPEAPRRPTTNLADTHQPARRHRPSTRATHRTRPHRPEPRHHPPHHDGRPHGDNTAAPARHIGHDPHANNLVSDTGPPPAARPEANRLAPLTNPYQQPGGTRPRRDRRFPGPKRGLVLYVLIRIARPSGQGSCQSGRPSDDFKGATVDPEGADLAGGGRALDAPPPPTISPDSRRPRTHLEPTSETGCSPGFRHPRCRSRAGLRGPRSPRSRPRCPPGSRRPPTPSQSPPRTRPRTENERGWVGRRDTLGVGPLRPLATTAGALPAGQRPVVIRRSPRSSGEGDGAPPGGRRRCWCRPG